MDKKYVHPAKEILRKTGVTQRKIAEYFGLSISQTKAILNGTYNMTPTRDRQLWELVEKCRIKDLRQ